MATVMDNMTVKPLSEALGAEISGINAAELDDARFEELRDVFHQNLVVVVKDQDLTPAQQTEFARRFGEIQYHISPEYLMKDQPEVMILSNEKQDGKFIGLPDGGSEWHSDHSYVDQPTGYTMLQAIKVPKDGGDTEWTNMVRAYEALPDDMQSRLDGLVGIHSFNRMKNQRLSVPVKDRRQQSLSSDVRRVLRCPDVVEVRLGVCLARRHETGAYMLHEVHRRLTHSRGCASCLPSFGANGSLPQV